MDPGTLFGDVLETASFLAVPALLWLFLYLLAWEDPATAQASGFGRRTFWLLAPVGWIASQLIALPFFGWDGNVVAINLAGGLFPLILAVLFLHRILGTRPPALGSYFLALAAQTAVLFGLVVGVVDPLRADLGALAVCLAGPAALWGWEYRHRGPAPGGPPATLALSLTSLVLLLTFLTTRAVLGLGIESVFPFYLIGPVAAGVIAVPITVSGLAAPRGASLSLAYAATTIGTLIGADVLRQPPLYGVGKPALLVIGGAGLLDLLYLSGLLAAASSYAFLRFSERRSTPAAPDPARAPPPRSPAGLLREALDLGVRGRNVESTAASVLAADLAAQEARRLLQVPTPSDGSIWTGLGVSPWVEADHQNLRALARAGRSDAVDAGRAWTTSQWLVRCGRDLARRRLATAARRGAAFGLDLAVTLPAAVLVWIVIAFEAPAGAGGLAISLPLAAAAIGYPSYAFLYLVLAEATTGTTLGKWAVGLEVTDRDQNRPGPMAALVRNIPKLAPLELVGVGGALITALLFEPIGSASALPGGLANLGLDAVVVATVLAGLVLLTLSIGWAGIQISPERQRVGDYLAGTWVLARPAASPPR